MARNTRRGSRRRSASDASENLTLVWRGGSVSVCRVWDGGLSIPAGDVPRLPGLVQLFHKDDFLGLVLLASEGVVGDEHRFHFKRRTLSNTVPPRDYAPEDDAPIALLPPPDRARTGL